MSKDKQGHDDVAAVVQRKGAAETDGPTRMGGKSAPNVSEARASIPTYDRASVKKVQTGMRGLKRN